MTMTNDEFIAHYGMSKDDAIQHYGVPGMKWGKRGSKASSDSGGSGGPKFGGAIDKKALKNLDRQSKEKDKAERSAAIDKARFDYNTKGRSRYLEAKATYKRDKHVIGKREAKKAFDKVKAQNLEDYAIGSQAKDGKEATKAILATVGVVVAYSVLGATLSKASR